jgi:hypothetical protein
MFLSLDQQARLRAVASGWYGDSRRKHNALTEKQTADRIDKVLAQLHAENPNAFVDTAVQQKDGTVVYTNIDARMGTREFYNEPKTIHPKHYKGFVKPYKPQLTITHDNPREEG